MKKRNIYYLFILLFLLSVALIFVCGYIESLPYGFSNNIDLTNRDIETTSKKWLNGHLGIFFRFQYFGIMNWMVLPLSLVWIVKRKEPWAFALAFAYFLTLLMISIRGYENWRYQLTIFPFTISVILLCAWDLMFPDNNSEKRIKGQIFFFVLFGCLVFLNFFVQRNVYTYRITDFVQGKTNAPPIRMISYLNNLKQNNSDLILVCDQIWFYYHTNKKGIDWQDPRLSHFYAISNGKEALGELKFLGIKYILTSNSFENLSADSSLVRKIVAITKENTETVYEDKGKKLLILRDEPERPLSGKIIDSLASRYSVVRNGSFENWPANQTLMPDFWHVYGTVSAQKEKSDKNVGQYALKITGDNFNLYQNVTLSRFPLDTIISCFAWIKTTIPDKYRIQIYDGIDSSFSERHTGDGKWHILRANHKINQQATSLEIRVIQAEKTGGLNDVVLVDGVLLFPGEYFSLNAFLMEKGRQ